MKNIFIKPIVLMTLSLAVFTSCVKEDDYAIPTVKIPFFQENFQDVTANTDLDIENWTNFAEEGSWKWREKTFSGNGYAEFSAFGSGATSNIAWLVTPQIDLTNYNKPTLRVDIAQHHLDVNSFENSLEVLISSDYDGTNVLNATWTPLNANIPDTSVSWYEFVTSTIDLSSYKEKVYIAFKFRGSGTNTNFDGAFQIDNVLFYNEN
ncbi:hypothetical protein [uncultured Flavobacterium sp.]|uniref:hypothetical protein n=1 Tax=uncultured Flavobacterium sp. TaxID=165435 RepID=UPI0030C7EB30